MRLAAAMGFATCVLVALLAFSDDSASRNKLELEPLIVHEAQPSKLIKHEVEWKAGFETTRHESMLVGPRMYSKALQPKKSGSAPILFGWYELPPSTQEISPRGIRTSSEGGNRSRSFELGEAAYFLSRTQQLDAGTPAEIPAGLSQFVAYRIIRGKDNRQQLESPVKIGGKEYSLNAPRFVCIPAEEWHHHEHFPVTDASACWLVYDIQPVEHTSSVSTLDQFGLNKLTLSSANWLCVPATVIDVASD